MSYIEGHIDPMLTGRQLRNPKRMTGRLHSSVIWNGFGT